LLLSEVMEEFLIYFLLRRYQEPEDFLQVAAVP
jgi:hypothetical protein